MESYRMKFSANAYLVLISIFITNIGNGMYLITVGKLLYDDTGSSLAFGILIIFQYIINIIVQLIAGPIVDRGNPKKTSVIVDMLRGISICLIYFLITYNVIPVFWLIMAITLIINIGKPFYRSATFAIGPAIAKGSLLIKYNALYEGFFQSGQLLGTALAGVVLMNYGVLLPIFLNGLSFVIAASLILCADIPEIEKNTSNPNKSWLGKLFVDWKETAIILKRNRHLAVNIILSSGNYLFVGFINIMLVPLVNNWYGGNTYWLSILDGSFAIGAALSAVLTSIINRMGTHRSTILCIIGQGFCFLFLALFHHTLLSVLFMMCIGIFNAVSITNFMTSLQNHCKGPIKGRIVTLRQVTSTIAISIFIPIVAQIQEISLDYSILVSSAICVFYAIAMLYLGKKKADLSYLEV